MKLFIIEKNALKGLNDLLIGDYKRTTKTYEDFRKSKLDEFNQLDKD